MMKKNVLKLLMSSVLAGVSIGAGSTLFILSKTFLGKAGLLVGACLFPIGLITICMMKWHLYTGKIGLILRPETDTNQLSKGLWLTIILIGNCIGAAIIGLALYGFSFIDVNSAFSATVKSIGRSKSIEFTVSSLFEMFLKSIVCGIFVYMAVRFFGKGKTMLSKIFGVFLPIMIFVYFGFQHCIANVTYMIAAGDYLITGMNLLSCLCSLIICIIGNSLGALIFDRLVD